MPKKSAIRSKDAYHHGDLRRQLLQAAKQLIRENGADQFKVSEACKLAGVSIAAPYRHFENRDDLLDHVVMLGLDDMKTDLTNAIAKLPRGSIESLTALGVGYVDFARRESNLFRLMFKPCDEPERHARLEAHGAQTYGVLLNEVASSLDKTAIDEQVLELALPMWTFVHGTAVLLIDDMLNVAEIDIDVEKMVHGVCTRLLGPAVGQVQ